ncbi:MAG: S9 family peptidase [Verrucomicrobiota bacterium]
MNHPLKTLWLLPLLALGACTPPVEKKESAAAEPMKTDPTAAAPGLTRQGDGEPSAELAAFAEAAARAPQPAAIAVETFFEDPKLAKVRLSPDGQRIAFLKPHKGKLNVHVADLPATGDVTAAFEAAVPVTHDENRSVISFGWSRDGQAILYAQDKDGNEKYHVYRVDPTQPDAEAIDLTPFEDVTARIVDMPKATPKEVLVAMNQRDRRFFDVYRLNIDTGEIDLIAENPGNIDSWYTDWDGKLLGARAKVEGVNDLFLYRANEADEFKPLAKYQVDEYAGLHSFSPDGKYAYFESARGSDKTRLLKLDLATGKEGEVIAQDEEVDFGSPIFSEKERKLLGVRFNKDRMEYRPMDPEFAQLLEDLGKIEDGDIIIADTDDAENKFIVGFSSPTKPLVCYLYDRATGEAHFLYNGRPKLKSEALADMLPVSFKARDGMTLHGYLTLPKGRGARDLPLIVNVHGGPWVRDSYGYDGEVQFWANRGYATLQINYRGSTGYGKEYFEAGNKEWGAKMLDDLVDGAQWAVDQGIADPNRLVIYGGSYGGYATLSALTFAPEVFAAGVNIVGPSNLFTLMESIPDKWHLFREEMYLRVGHPEKDKELLRARSPVFHAENIRAPLFIAHGAQDQRVKLAEAEQIVEAMQANGQEYELMVKEDDGHGFLNAENRIEFFNRAAKFLQQHVPTGDAPAAP